MWWWGYEFLSLERTHITRDRRSSVIWVLESDKNSYPHHHITITFMYRDPTSTKLCYTTLQLQKTHINRTSSSRPYHGLFTAVNSQTTQRNITPLVSHLQNSPLSPHYFFKLVFTPNSRKCIQANALYNCRRRLRKTPDSTAKALLMCCLQVHVMDGSMMQLHMCKPVSV